VEVTPTDRVGELSRCVADEWEGLEESFVEGGCEGEEVARRCSRGPQEELRGDVAVGAEEGARGGEP
jgi:hypothetical protein